MKFLLSALSLFLLCAERTYSTFSHLPGGPSGQVPLGLTRTPVFQKGRMLPFVRSPYEGRVLVFEEHPGVLNPVGPAGFGGGSVSLNSKPFYFGSWPAHGASGTCCNYKSPRGFSVGGAGFPVMKKYPFAEIGSPSHTVDIGRL